MKFSLLFFLLLISISAFASEKIQDSKIIECTLGVHDVGDGNVYQKTIHIPLESSTTKLSFAELTYLNKELLLRVEVSSTFKESERRLIIQLFDNIEIGKSNPDEAGNDKKMWAHNLGISSFVVNHNAEVPNTWIEVKVQGAQQDQEALSAYVGCRTPLN